MEEPISYLILNVLFILGALKIFNIDFFEYYNIMNSSRDFAN